MTKIVIGNQKTYMNFDDVQKFEKKFFSAILDALLKKSENFV